MLNYLRLPLFLSLAVLYLSLFNDLKGNRVKTVPQEMAASEVIPLCKEKPIRVLSLDGGGVRGIVAATILKEIERRAGKPICELFDLIVGNSAGGLVGLALVTPNDQLKPKYAAADLVEFYRYRAGNVFKRSLIRKFYTGWGLWCAKYDKDQYYSILRELFGNKKLTETLCPIVIVSYSLSLGEIHLWSSKTCQEYSRDFYLRDIAAATSAAPTYFPPKKVIDTKGECAYCEADGAIYANNPTEIAVLEAFKNNNELQHSDILIVSVGTGMVKFNNAASSLPNSGIIGWVLQANLIDIMMTADSQFAERAIEIMYPNSYRFQVELPRGLGSLDNVSSQNVQELIAATEQYIERNTQLFDELCEKLKKS